MWIAPATEAVTLAQEPAPRALDTDSALMKRVAAGEQEAFAVVVDRHKDGLVGYLTRLTRSRERAEDLAQEAFLRLYAAAGRYREEGHLTAFLYRIATNLLRTEERRAKRWRLISAAWPPHRWLTAERDEGAVDGRLLARERSSHLAGAIAELPLTQRAALVLAEIEGWPLREVARTLGCQEGTIKSRLFRARARLKEKLAPYFEERPS